MRTTVTLDPDVKRILDQKMRERGVSFKEALNDSVRASAAKPGATKRFVQKTHSMGQPSVPLNKALALAAALEDDELIRKLALGK